MVFQVSPSAAESFRHILEGNSKNVVRHDQVSDTELVDKS